MELNIFDEYFKSNGYSLEELIDDIEYFSQEIEHFDKNKGLAIVVVNGEIFIRTTNKQWTTFLEALISEGMEIMKITHGEWECATTDLRNPENVYGDKSLVYITPGFRLGNN